MKFIELESERLIYRKFRDGDFSVLFDMFNNPENMKYRCEPLTESQSHEYLQWAIANSEEEVCKKFRICSCEESGQRIDRFSYAVACTRGSRNRLVCT